MSGSGNISAASCIAWKEEILRESRETIQNLQAETTPFADLADRASTEAERQLELRTRDRQRKLIAKIDSALRRLEDGSYGFCEETGEPISLKRLDARPIATLSIEAQERHERREKVYQRRLMIAVGKAKRPDLAIRPFALAPPLTRRGIAKSERHQDVVRAGCHSAAAAHR